MTDRQKETTHFLDYSWRTTDDSHNTCGGDRRCPCHSAPLNCFHQICSFSARGYWQFVLKCPYCRKNAYNFVISPPRATKLKKIKATNRLVGLRRNAENFAKKCANEPPLRDKFWQFWGLYFHISVSMNVMFVKFHVYRAMCCSCGANNHYLTTKETQYAIPACIAGTGPPIRRSAIPAQSGGPPFRTVRQKNYIRVQ